MKMHLLSSIIVFLFVFRAAESAATCEDRATPKYCQENKDLCDDPFGADTKYYCKKTCGLCQDATSAPGNDCSDRGTPAYCKENKDSCDDPFGSDTRYYCRKTCGLCKDPNEVYTTKAPVPVNEKTTETPACKDDYTTEECIEKKYLCTNALLTDFKQSCRKTCGLCVDPNAPKTTTPVCKDDMENCEAKKYLCTNALLTDYKFSCKKTCGLC